MRRTRTRQGKVTPTFINTTRCFTAVAALLLVIAARPAGAQSGYIGASLGGDVARFTHSELDGNDDDAGSGEALSFALRVGTSLGERWGVELEFARPQEIEQQIDQDYRILSTTSILSFDRIGTIPTDLIPVIAGYQPINFEITTRQRNSTLAASAWFRQEISRRFSLVYLGGLGFYRVAFESEYGFTPAIRALLAPTIFPASDRTITYGVGPVAGIEARVGLTDHVQVIPGVRIQGLDRGWLVRPAVGIGWQF